MTETDQTPETVPSPRKPVARRRILISVIAASAVLTVGGGAAAWQLLTPPAQAETNVPAPNTVPAARGPLNSAIRTGGTIAYTNTREFPATLGGILTELPKPGTVVALGESLYKVNDQPVIAMNGSIPAWREFAAGMSDGPDVKQLQQNLSDLGFYGGWISEEFNDLTTSAIKEWQKANGLKVDGVIPLGGVVFGANGLRVGAPKATIGSTIAPGAPIYEASGSAPVITAEIPVAERGNVPVGTKASITLPNGTTVTGKVTAAGDPTEKEDKGSGQKSVVVPLTIAPDDPKTIADQVALSVQIAFTHELTKDALQVPVSALLASGTNQFAVEVHRNKKIVRVPVETGAFASGMVEITGGKLKAGDAVVVPK